MSVQGAPVFVEGRGKFVQLTRDPATGDLVAGTIGDMRTPRFVQSDLSAYQDFHVSKTNEKLVARVGADCLNCFNQHHPTIISSNMIVSGSIVPNTCDAPGTPACPAGASAIAGFDYAAMMTKGYNYTGQANADGVTKSNLYGTPQAWQRPRTMRFQVRFTF
jgi:hypothetical protein